MVGRQEIKKERNRNLTAGLRKQITRKSCSADENCVFSKSLNKMAKCGCLSDVKGVVHHLGLCGCEVWSVGVIRQGVEDNILDKNADRSAYVGGEQVNVDVITRAMEPSFWRKEERDVSVLQW